ncbi:tRNA (cytosine-5-)-methyltransferase-like [Tropilaelaps mercedesae]|uniref:tRNA (Cytosine-5-)-methyltransferase-like n=1 Tax=Tropilaelaps mercedesae TaxID=418985 RepID=A0A1V9XY19_9ACAR|nr:tRNA (cytosine-5-)-methyltransferase-like [Tropilaelaps mercedesae]
MDPLEGQPPMATLRVLELYSGIGGMHFALRNAFSENGGMLANYKQFKIVAAVDINTVANTVYETNFGGKVLNRQIQSLLVEELSGDLSSSIWIMSPPCQPFTRQGKQLGADDPRTASFLHILDILPKLKAHKPKFIFLENVKGFESSPVRDAFLDCLERCGLVYLQCLLSPKQFNVPNSRLRYYCMAIEKSLCVNSLFGTDRNAIISDASALGLNEDLTATIGDYLDKAVAKSEELVLDETTISKNAAIIALILHFCI